MNDHEREVNDFACGKKTRRGPPAALPGEDVWWYAWGAGAHRPCAACHAIERPMAALSNLCRENEISEEKGRGHAVRRANMQFSLGLEFF